MPEYLSPGVYVEETEGSKSVAGVSTSTAGFLGQTERGPLKPQLVTGFNDYKRTFGGYVEGFSLRSDRSGTRQPDRIVWIRVLSHRLHYSVVPGTGRTDLQTFAPEL